MSFGDQVQARTTRLLGRAQTVDGRVVTISEIEYSEAIAGVGTRGVAVDLGGNQNAGAVSYGFSDRAQAERFLTGLEAEDYTVTDAAGRTLTQTRVGLGIPDGMIRWVDNAQPSGNVVPAVSAVIPPNAAQYPQQAAALNAPPDAADQPHGNLSGAGHRNATP